VATSKCAKCDSTRFELVLKDGISGSRYKFNFIQCASCGAVVGVVDYYNIGAVLEKIGKKIGVDI